MTSQINLLAELLVADPRVYRIMVVQEGEHTCNYYPQEFADKEFMRDLLVQDMEACDLTEVVCQGESGSNITSLGVFGIIPENKGEEIADYSVSPFCESIYSLILRAQETVSS